MTNDELKAMSERLDKAVDIIRRAHRYVGKVRSDDVDGDDPIFALLDEMEAFLLRDEAKAELERLREALEDIARGDYSDPMCQRTPEAQARAALEGKR